MTGADAVVLRESPLESARFGLRVFRCDVSTIDAAAIADAIERERADVLILRVPAREIGAVRALAASGFVTIVADTLVYYDIELLAGAPERDASVTLRPAAIAEGAQLAHMAREVFAGYVSHYHANPLFERARILDGYAEWAARHLEQGSASGAWFVEREGAAVGFSCYRIDAVSGVATGVLNGILPAARERGAYRAMLRAMLGEFAGMGLRRFDISTQVHNIAVQRTWASLGLRLRHASNTVHINALRGNAANRR